MLNSAVANALVGNWTLSDAHNYHSGNLIALNCANTLGNGVVFTDARMCNANGGPILTGQDRTSLNPNSPASLWFNAAAFSVPGQYAFGTSSQYNTKFRQPPILGDNAAPDQAILYLAHGDGNRLRLQLRADAQNVFNRTNFSVNGAVGNVNFSRAAGPQQGLRYITLGAGCTSRIRRLFQSAR